jgi:predicted transposase YbfD/YdcC
MLQPKNLTNASEDISGENKVHYVRDVTQGEDSSRIRTTPLPQILLLLVTLLSIYIETKCLKISHKLKDSVHLA